MRLTKKGVGAGAAAALTLILFPKPADAQMMTAAEIAAAQRTAPPAVTGEAVRRTVPIELQDGIAVRDPGFSAGFYFYRNRFGTAFEGYVDGGRFYPYGFGRFAFDPFIFGVANPFCPWPIPYGAGVAAEWANVSRFTLPIGASIYPGPPRSNLFPNPLGAPASYVSSAPIYDAWGRIIPQVVVTPAPASTTVNEKMFEAYVSTRDALEAERIERAKREARDEFEREQAEKNRTAPGMPAAQPAQSTTSPQLPVVPPEPPQSMPVYEFHSQYAEDICDSQKKEYVTAFLNELFGTLGHIKGQERPYSAFMGNTPMILIRDRNNSVIGRINSSRYMNRKITTSQLRESAYNEVRALDPRMPEARDATRTVPGTYDCR